MFFKNFPSTEYNDKLVKNISKRVEIREGLKDNIALFEEYIVKEGETPEMLADMFYNDPYYWWVIILMNNMQNPWHDWVKSARELDDYVKQKYNDPYAVHHYEKDGYIVDPDHSVNPTSVTNYEYEERKNEEKREIKILQSRFIPDVEQEMKELLG